MELPEIRELEIENTAKVLVANPNPDRTYEDVLGGKKYYFAPLSRFSIETNFADMLATRARDNWENQKFQASSERREYAKCISSKSVAVQDRARLFADERGNPRTKPLSFPGLVRMDTADGERFLAEGLKMSTRMEKEARVIPDKEVEAEIPDFEETENLKEEGYYPQTPPPGMQEAPQEKMMQGNEATTFQLEHPQIDWSMLKLFNYVRDNGVKLDSRSKSEGARLNVYRTAIALFRNKRDTLDSTNTPYELIE